MKRNACKILFHIFVVLVIALLFLPMCYTPTPFLLGFPITRKERALDRTLKIHRARHDIEMLYEFGEDLRDFEEFGRAIRDPWGHTYNVFFWTTNEFSGDGRPEKEEAVSHKSRSGIISSLTNASCRIAGKAVVFDHVTVFVWSSGPDGINDKTRGDDVVLR